MGVVQALGHGARAAAPAALGFSLLCLCLALATNAAAQSTAPESPTALRDPQAACLAGFLETGADDLTLGEMRARCAAAPNAEITGHAGNGANGGNTGLADSDPGALQARAAEERSAAPNPFSLLTHKPNYLLLGAWNERGWNPDAIREATNDPDRSLQDVEIQFQLSIKVPLALGLFGDRVDLYGAYTNRSFWQAYDTNNSRPFRETNHEPELWAQFANGRKIGGFTNVVNRIGYVHQSNGRTEPLSRSWDRLYAEFIFERGAWGIGIKPWVLIGDEDDNPDIEDFLGHGEVRVAWAPEDHRHVLSLMLRNQLESGFDHGAVEFGWSFPLFDYPWVKGYVQYFYGYGESLIDYNQRVHRIGAGLSFSDWLD